MLGNCFIFSGESVHATTTTKMPAQPKEWTLLLCIPLRNGNNNALSSSSSSSFLWKCAFSLLVHSPRFPPAFSPPPLFLRRPQSCSERHRGRSPTRVRKKKRVCQNKKIKKSVENHLRTSPLTVSWQLAEQVVRRFFRRKKYTSLSFPVKTYIVSWTLSTGGSTICQQRNTHFA